MASSKNIDQERAKLYDIIQSTSDHLAKLRDYAAVPENVWLARGELDTLSRLVSELETALDDIKEQDSENGY